jgi:SAM-dependent methyltransferase
MPDLNAPLHLQMLRQFHDKKADRIYGLEWGDPETVAPLKFIRDSYVLPYVNYDRTAVEIGPGGGRWTRYLLKFRQLYVVDYHAELLDELKKNFSKPNMAFIKNNGTDFPGIKKESVDYLFSFGTFVHLDIPLIQAYLENMRTILKPDANAVIQYSDMTKIMAQKTPGFSENTPDLMRKMVTDAGYRIVEEDLTSLWHSSVVRFTRK